jgi:hypothetical protein
VRALELETRRQQRGAREVRPQLIEPRDRLAACRTARVLALGMYDDGIAARHRDRSRDADAVAERDEEIAKQRAQRQLFRGEDVMVRQEPRVLPGEQAARPLRTTLARDVLPRKILKALGGTDPFEEFGTARDDQDCFLGARQPCELGHHPAPQFRNGGRFVDPVEKLVLHGHRSYQRVFVKESSGPTPNSVKVYAGAKCVPDHKAGNAGMLEIRHP